MEDIKLTDEVVIPIMQKHNISREEAESRLQLLFKSGILITGNPDSNETKRIIDNFLAQPSDVLIESVAFEKILNECLSNKQFVRQYDRLHFTNLTKALRSLEDGNRPNNMQKQIHDFGEFVRETVFERLVNDTNQLN